MATKRKKAKNDDEEVSPELAAQRKKVREAIDGCVKRIELAQKDVDELRKQGSPLLHRAEALVKQLQHKHAKAVRRARDLYGLEVPELPMPSVDDSPPLTDDELGR